MCATRWTSHSLFFKGTLLTLILMQVKLPISYFQIHNGFNLKVKLSVYKNFKSMIIRVKWFKRFLVWDSKKLLSIHKRFTLTYLAPSLHWDFSKLKLNVIRALNMLRKRSRQYLDRLKPISELTFNLGIQGQDFAPWNKLYLIWKGHIHFETNRFFL